MYQVISGRVNSISSTTPFTNRYFPSFVYYLHCSLPFNHGHDPLLNKDKKSVLLCVCPSDYLVPSASLHLPPVFARSRLQPSFQTVKKRLGLE